MAVSMSWCPLKGLEVCFGNKADLELLGWCDILVPYGYFYKSAEDHCLAGGAVYGLRLGVVLWL